MKTNNKNTSPWLPVVPVLPYSKQHTEKSVVVCQACVRGLLDYVVLKSIRVGGDLGKALLTLFAVTTGAMGGSTWPVFCTAF